MEFEPEDQEIVNLLTRLKNRGGTYPKRLFSSRRQVFLRQMASIGLGLGIGAGIKTVAKSSRGGSLFHLPSISATSVLETILLLAIATQAGIIVYSYRDKIADYVNSLSVQSAPTAILIPVTGSSSTNVVNSSTPTPTMTVTASVTPSPSNTATNLPSSTSVDEEGSSTTSSDTVPGVTPQPTNNNDNNGNNGDNGNHYGQTPGPPQPKEEPKPTKSKDSGKKQ
jgi:hypothetical protein